MSVRTALHERTIREPAQSAKPCVRATSGAWSTGRALLIVWLLPVLVSGCRRSELANEPTLNRFMTYDLHTSRVERDPSRGFILQCMERRDGALSFAQFMNEDGTLAGTVRYRTLPHTVDGVVFNTGNILFTDLVPLDNGNAIVVGLGRDSIPGGAVALHLLLYEVDRSGEEVSSPTRHLVASDSRTLRYARAATDDTISIATPNALGVELIDHDLAIAVAFRSIGALEDSIALFRVPRSGSGLPFARTSIGSEDGNLESGQNRIREFQRRETQGDHVLLLSGKNDPVLSEFDLGGVGIVEVTHARLDVPMACVPHFLAQDGNMLLAGGIGNRTTPTASSATPLFTTTSDITNTALWYGYEWLDSLPPLDSPIQCFTGTWWNGAVALATNTYAPEVATSLTLDLFTYYNDTESDLGLVLVSPENGRILEQSTVVSARGLQAIGLFNVNGRLVFIGAQNAFYNAEAERTFFLELRRPGQ